MNNDNNDRKRISVLPIVENVEFMFGTSQKTGNEYVVGSLELKSPISDTPIRIAFDYIDPNTRELIKLSIEKYQSEERDKFAK